MPRRHANVPRPRQPEVRSADLEADPQVKARRDLINTMRLTQAGDRTDRSGPPPFPSGEVYVDKEEQARPGESPHHQPTARADQPPPAPADNTTDDLPGQ